MSNTGSCGYADVVGEAVPVDVVSPGSTVFVTLKQSDDPRSGPEWVPLKAYGLGGAPGYETAAKVRLLSGKRSLPTEYLPLLVHFRDIKNPATVERVEPGDFGRIFGAQVSLRGAFVEMTSDRVTTGIAEKLTWLPDLRKRGASLDGDARVTRSSNELANSLGPGNFQTGVAAH